MGATGGDEDDQSLLATTNGRMFRGGQTLVRKETASRVRGNSARTSFLL